MQRQGSLNINERCARLTLVSFRGAIFDAVLRIHNHGIIHGDLHEVNIRIDPVKKRTWIIDFGRARAHKCEHPPVKYTDLVPLVVNSFVASYISWDLKLRSGWIVVYFPFRDSRSTLISSR
jgi:predicted Ser/Thr protein kinase